MLGCNYYHDILKCFSSLKNVKSRVFIFIFIKHQGSVTIFINTQHSYTRNYFYDSHLGPLTVIKDLNCNLYVP